MVFVGVSTTAVVGLVVDTGVVCLTPAVGAGLLVLSTAGVTVGSVGDGAVTGEGVTAVKGWSPDVVWSGVFAAASISDDVLSAVASESLGV